MITIDPAVSGAPLSEAKLGALVQSGNKVGICVTGSRAPSTARAIAWYDQEKCKFILEDASSTSPEVLVFGNALVVMPKLESAFKLRQPDASSSGELFIAQKTVYVVVHGSAANFLDLSSGVFEKLDPRTPQMSGYGEWALGVRNSCEQFTSLINVQTAFGQEFDDEESVEPDDN